jgi:hypothetical protein
MNKLTGVLVLVVGLAGCAAVSTRKAPTRGERRALKASASSAYDLKDFAKCGDDYERAGDAYNAACCFALAGEPARAFGQLAVEAKRGEVARTQAEQDSDLASLKGDPRWGEMLKAFETGRAARLATMNAELAAIFEADQGDRQGSNLDWQVVKPRDEAREKRVNEILAGGGAKVSADYFHAAMVFQHGGTPAHALRAHELALEAVKLDGSNDPARWLAAASLDRKLMYEKKPQRYGTQFHREGDGPWVLWEVDPSVTDAEREEWNVPALDDARKRVAQMNQKEGAP